MLVALALACGGDPAEDEGRILVPFGARWQVADRPPEGPAWTRPGFDAQAWLSGVAPVGWGEGDEQTLLPPAWGSQDDDAVTALRHRFRVDDPDRFQRLRFRLVHDDGAVVFLNGAELFRSNVRSFPLTPELPAVTPRDSVLEDQVFEFWVDAAGLLAGENVVAVELRQNWEDPSEGRLDLELAAIGPEDPLRVLRGPYLQSASATGLVVRWRTNRPAVGQLRYGPLGQALASEAGGGAARVEHEVTLAGLEPGAEYAYQLLADGRPLPDELFSFRTLPEPGAEVPVRLWVLGDSGTADANAAAVRDGFEAFRGERAADAILMLGDNAYPTGSDADHQAAVFDLFPEQLASTPLYAVLGNHGANLSDTREKTGPFFDIWSNPSQGESGGPASGNEAYFAVDLANVRLVAIDSAGSSFKPRAPMMRWLRRALAGGDAEWRIAYLHHPGLSAGTHDLEASRRTYAFWESLLPVLEAADVDLVLAGHSHSYERSFLLGGTDGDLASLGESVLDAGDGRPDGDGPYARQDEGTVWIVSGSSGQAGHEGDLDHPAMAVSLRDLGSLVLDIDGCQLDGRFVQPGGRVADHFRIEKCD